MNNKRFNQPESGSPVTAEEKKFNSPEIAVQVHTWRQISRTVKINFRCFSFANCFAPRLVATKRRKILALLPVSFWFWESPLTAEQSIIPGWQPPEAKALEAANDCLERVEFGVDDKKPDPVSQT